MKLSEVGIVLPIQQIRKLRLGEVEELFLITELSSRRAGFDLSLCLHHSTPQRRGGHCPLLSVSDLTDFQPSAPRLERLSHFGHIQQTPFHHLTAFPDI